MHASKSTFFFQRKNLRNFCFHSAPQIANHKNLCGYGKNTIRLHPRIWSQFRNGYFIINEHNYDKEAEDLLMDHLIKKNYITFSFHEYQSQVFCTELLRKPDWWYDF